jgi:hypothetical protein
MTRIAWRMLAQRPASMIATLLALFFAVGIVTTCGAMLESGIRYHGAMSRYAAAPVLVATTKVQVTHGSGENRETTRWPSAASWTRRNCQGEFHHPARRAGAIRSVSPAVCGRSR